MERKVSVPRRPSATAASSGRGYSLGRLARAEFYDVLSLLRESYKALLGFVVVVLMGAFYLQAHYAIGLARALYESLRLLAFQSGLGLPSDPIGVAVFFLVPIVGLVLVVQSVLNFGRLLLDKSGRTTSWQLALAKTYDRHIVVCGLGRVGIRVVTRLVEAGYDVVAIERQWDSRFVERALALRVPVVTGDASDTAVLRQAGVGRARAVVAAIDNDLLDIEIALAARTVRPRLRVILRAFSQELDRNLERTFGLHSVFSSSALAAPTFAAATVARGLDYVLPVGGGEELLGVAQVTLEAATLPASLAALEAQLEVCVLDEGNATAAPVRGQSLTLIGKLRRVAAARTQLEGDVEPVPQRRRDTIIVCGLGKVGYRVVMWLARREPSPRIVVVSTGETPPTFLREVRELAGVTIIEGDARDGDVLRQAEVTSATAVAALTASDQANLQIALEARRLQPDVHVVLRVFSDALADQMIGLFGIHTAYSTSSLSSATLAAAAAIGEVSRGFLAGGKLFAVRTITLPADHPLVGRTLASLRAREGVLGVWLSRAGVATRLPPLETSLGAGDTVTVVGTLAAIARVPGK